MSSTRIFVTVTNEISSEPAVRQRMKEGDTLQDLLDDFGVSSKKADVFINDEIVDDLEYELEDGDQIKFCVKKFASGLTL